MISNLISARVLQWTREPSLLVTPISTSDSFTDLRFHPWDGVVPSVECICCLCYAAEHVGILQGNPFLRPFVQAS